MYNTQKHFRPTQQTKRQNTNTHHQQKHIFAIMEKPNPYHSPTPEHLQGEKQSDQDRKRICEKVLELERLKKLEKAKGKKKINFVL